MHSFSRAAAVVRPMSLSIAPLAAAIRLLACGSLLALPQALSAQERSESSADLHSPLEHVLVTVPIHKKSAETALPVTILTGAALQERAAQSIGATLAGQPGLASASFGPAVGQPVIRGHAGPRVRVLQNGIASADAASSSSDHAITVEPLLADAVEVVRGPATLLYGGGAIGGVVNVIDNRIPRKAPGAPVSGAVEYRHDSATDGDTTVLRLDGGSERVAFHLSGVYRDWNDVEVPGLAFDRDVVEDIDESARGYIANSAGRNRAVTGGISWLFESGHVGFAVSDMEQRYGIPSGGHLHAHEEHDEEEHAEEDHDHHHDDHGDEHAEHGDILIDLQQTRYDLAGEWHPHGPWLDGLRARLAYTDYEHRELEAGAVATTFTNETWEGRLELIHAELAGWHGVMGLQWRQTDFAALGEESFIPASDRRALGLFVLEDFHAGAWTYELGARIDREEIEADGQRDQRFTAISGSAAALWQVTPAWQAGLSLALAERAPVVEELYSNAGNADWHIDHFHFHDPVTHAATQVIEVGNAELEEEMSRNVDFSLRYDAEGVDADVTLFYNDFSDYIYLADTGFSYDEVAVYAYAQEDARFYGLEAELGLPVAEWGANSLRVTFYGDAVRGELKSGGDVPRLPPYRIGARMDWERDGLRGFVDLLHAADQDRAAAGESETDGYHRLDAGISYDLAAATATTTTLFLRGTNLTDQTIRASTSFLRAYAPEPGRSVEAGVRVRF